MRYKCLNCGYIYDEEKEFLGFNDLNAEWICPECGTPKLDFELMEQETDPEVSDFDSFFEKDDKDLMDEDDEDFLEQEDEDEDFGEEFEEDY